MLPDFPPASAPLEVDRVEWVPASSESVHVCVYGRWIDRPVAEPLHLLVGTERRRHGFDAMAEPPPGVLVAFAVPNELRGRLAIDIALQIGAQELVLPAAGPGAVPSRESRSGDEPEGEVIERAVLAERRARRAELAEESLARRATEAEQTAGTLEAQLVNLEERLAAARDERDELESRLADAERRLRSAQQREYAEQQLRIEAQDELDRVRHGEDDVVAELRERLAAANRRAEDMAREVDRARRATAEALQLRARSGDLESALEAERAARTRAETALAELREQIAQGHEAAETELAAARQVIAERSAELERAWAELARARRDADALGPERSARRQAEHELAEARERVSTEQTAASEALAALAAEQARRAELESQVADALAAVRDVRAQDEARAARDAAIQRLVAEVLATAASLREAFERESRRLESELTARVVEERRRMAEELAEVRAEQRTRSDAAQSVIDDLSTAAERLRQQAPAEPEPDEEPEPEGWISLQPRRGFAAGRDREPWLARALQRLTAADAAVAAQLVRMLLAVHGLRVSDDVAYDLTITELGQFRVTLVDGESAVVAASDAGARRDVDFRVQGSVEQLSGFVAGGLTRRPGGVRVEGSRRRFRRLVKALREPTGLAEIARAGAGVDPGVILAALVAGIDPAWTVGHSFSVAWVVGGDRGRTWTVQVGQGLPRVISGPPAARASATVHMPLAVFVPLLAGFPPPPGESAHATGDVDAVLLLRGWFDQVQGLA